MNKFLKLSVVCASVVVLLNGCGDKESTIVTSDVSTLENTISSQNSTLSAQEKKIAELQALLNKKGSAVSTGYNGNNSLLPPNAKPGECYARVLVPAKYSLKQVKVLKKEASKKIRIIPATYKLSKKQVVARAESYKLVTVPATYKYVEQKIQVEPAKTTIVKVPAKYKTVQEKILIKPAYITWKRGRGEVEKVDYSTGEIMCLVEVPAEYKVVTKRVLVSPATTKKLTSAPVYKTIRTKVVDKEAYTKKVVIPAVYKTITIKEVATPAKESVTAVPAEYQTITKRVITSDAKLNWKSILCETNTTPSIIRDLQSALKAKGYNVGPVDSVYGAQTKAAVRKYQKDNGLAIGALTLETLKSLKVL